MATIENGKRYRWAYPSDWLNDKIASSDDVVFLRGVIDSLMSNLPEDDLQDLFQTEMDADGYFATETPEEEPEG